MMGFKNIVGFFKINFDYSIGGGYVGFVGFIVRVY